MRVIGSMSGNDHLTAHRLRLLSEPPHPFDKLRAGSNLLPQGEKEPVRQAPMRCPPAGHRSRRQASRPIVPSHVTDGKAPAAGKEAAPPSADVRLVRHGCDSVQEGHPGRAPLQSPRWRAQDHRRRRPARSPSSRRSSPRRWSLRGVLGNDDRETPAARGNGRDLGERRRSA